MLKLLSLIFQQGKLTDWLMVTMTFIYVITTVIICWYTHHAIKESRKQFKETNRAWIDITFEIIRGGLYVLEIHNHGKQIAQNLNIQINPEFIAAVANRDGKASLQSLANSSFDVGIDKRLHILIAGAVEDATLSKHDIKLNYSYNDSFGLYEYTKHIPLAKYPDVLFEYSIADTIKKSTQEITESLASLKEVLSTHSKISSDERSPSLHK